MTKYYLQYTGTDSVCNIELEARNDKGARKLAQHMAKQCKIQFYDIVYRCTDGRLSRVQPKRGA